MARSPSLTKSIPGLARTVRAFWPYVRQERRLIATSLGAMLGVVLLRVVEPWPLKFIFDGVLMKDAAGSGTGIPFLDDLTPGTLLAVAAGAIVLIVGLRALTAYHSTVGFALIGNRVLTEVRGQLYRHLQRLSLSFHQSSRDGDMVIRVIGDVGMLKEVAVTAVLPMFGHVLVFLFMVGVMLWMDWRLALLGLSILPLFGLFSVRLGKRIQEVSRKQRKREGAMASTAAEAMGAIKTVQALSLEDSFASSFSSQNKQSLKEGVKAKRLQANLERRVDVLIALATALVLYLGGRRILAAQLSPGDLLVFLSYLKTAYRPLKDLAKYTGRLAKASAAGERVLEILEREVDVQNLPDATPAPRLRGHLQFEAVEFAYEETPVLTGFQLEVLPGQHVALVGTSGEGKSTLLSLIPRLYDPRSGRILIDGTDIRRFTLETLRPQISIVLQETLLFGLSVYDNIALGTPDATPDSVRAAARHAHAHGFIEELPAGYDTPLGERGANLSGGQRQRLSIARAALRGAPILLLDEPTTGLDEESQQAVIQALQDVTQGVTTLLATHDLDLAATADEIVFLEKGQIIERGTHQELVARGGRYAALHRLQASTGAAARHGA